jgi:protein-disulfide isomerase
MVNRVVVSLLVLTVGIQMFILYRQHSAPVLGAPTIEPVEAIAARALTVSVKDAPRLGDDNARLAIVEFADYECPFCRRHANDVFPSLKKEFIDTGLAAYYYFHLPLKMHPHAIDAANAAECARTQGRFWKMHDLLFSGREPTSLRPDTLRTLASSVGIDLGAYDTCISTVAGRIAEDVAQAKRLDIVSTPVVLLGTVAGRDTVKLTTRINGAQPMDVFANAINELRRQSGAKPRASVVSDSVQQLVGDRALPLRIGLLLEAVGANSMSPRNASGFSSRE